MKLPVNRRPTSAQQRDLRSRVTMVLTACAIAAALILVVWLILPSGASEDELLYAEASGFDTIVDTGDATLKEYPNHGASSSSSSALTPEEIEEEMEELSEYEEELLEFEEDLEAEATELDNREKDLDIREADIQEEAELISEEITELENIEDELQQKEDELDEREAKIQEAEQSLQHPSAASKEFNDEKSSLEAHLTKHNPK